MLLNIIKFKDMAYNILKIRNKKPDKLDRLSLVCAGTMDRLNFTKSIIPNQFVYNVS